MSVEEPQAAAIQTEGDEGEELTPGYKTPKKLDLQTIQDMDADDEALNKYKQQLLGETADVKDEGGCNVLVQKMIICPDGAAEIELDLSDLDSLKSHPVTLTEGCLFSIKIQFRVQREIVSGLRYFQKSKKMGLKDKSNIMVGSYGPKTEAHIFQTKPEKAPSGMLVRGSFNVTSKFTDDDKNVYLEWDWVLKIVKE